MEVRAALGEMTNEAGVTEAKQAQKSTAFSFRRDKPAPPAGAEPLPAYTTPAGSVFARDAFYGTLLETARAQIKKKNHGALAGTIAWAWGGEGRPPADGSSWKMGDDFTGDPPSEAQGANSIFDTDISTLEVLRRHATALGQL